MNKFKKIAITIFGILSFFSIISTVYAVQVTVPSAPNAGYFLAGLSTGNWLASSTNGATFGYINATSTIATSTFANGINITKGCFAVNGTCFTGGSSSGTVNSGIAQQAAYYATNGNTVSGTSTLNIYTDRVVSVGVNNGLVANPAQLEIGEYQTSGSASPSILINGQTNFTGIGNAFTSAGNFMRIGVTSGYAWPTFGATQFSLGIDGRLGVGTTTPGTLLGIQGSGSNGINFDPNATSTFNGVGGLNLNSGCFSIAGTCIGSGGGGSGTVTSISGSGGTTGLTLTGGPITTSGTLTLGGTLGISNGGTGATSAQNASNAIGGVFLCPNLGVGISNCDTSAPATTGQFAVNPYGTSPPEIFTSSGTGVGGFRSSAAFPNGISEIGDLLHMDANSGNTIVWVDGGTKSTATGDAGFVSASGSNNPQNSGSQICVAIMYPDFAKVGSSTLGSTNSSCMVHVPVNRGAFLSPGNSYFVYNADSVNNKNVQIESPNIGPDLGNYSFVNMPLVGTFKGHFQIPFWQSGIYQPGDRLEVFTVSGITVTPNVEDVYTVGGKRYTPHTNTVSGGSGTITFTGTSTPVGSSGTLTKDPNISDSSDNTISYSAVFQTSNQWLNTVDYDPSMGSTTMGTTTISNLTVGSCTGCGSGSNYFTNSGTQTYLSTGTKLGIGTTNPVDTLSIGGNVDIGASLAGLPAAPVNGLIVQGLAEFGNPGVLSLANQANVSSSTATILLRLQKQSGDSQTATTSVLGADYLQVGGQEYQNGGLYGIGLGYLNNPGVETPPVMIVASTTSISGNTIANMGFLLRTAGTAGAKPTEDLTITSGGNVGIGSTTPNSILAIGSGNGINFTAATSTFYSSGGINLTNGCYAVAGTCIGNGSGSGTVTTLTAGTNVTFSSGATCTTTCTINATGGGTGNVATSTNETAGTLAYWTSNSGTPATLGKVSTSTISTSGGITTTNGSFVIGSGLTIGCTTATGSVPGCLSTTDWNTFNGKQTSGNYITALTGDVTASGPGSSAATLATVNSNVGSFTNANITVNAKGLITAASNGSGSSGAPYPFQLTGNATSTLTQFNGGLTSYASTTIGNGSITGGLTVNGNSTTTGSVLIQKNGANAETILYNDNSFGAGASIENTNTGTQALTKIQIANSSGAEVGQLTYAPSNFIDPTIQDTMIFSSEGTTKLAFQAAPSDAFHNPDIYFRSGTNVDAIHIVGSDNAVGINTASPGFNLTVNGSVGFSGLSSATSQNAVCINPSTKEVVTAGNTTCITSSLKTKHDITDLSTEEVNTDISELNPVAFTFNETGERRLGFIAEDVNKIDPRLVEYAQQDTQFPGATGVIKKGDPISVEYANITALLVKNAQVVNAEIEAISSSGRRSVEENWQWFVITLLGVGFIYQQFQIRKLKK